MSDFTRLTRADWLGLAQRLYGRLERTFASLSQRDWERTTPYLGWRARDVLAHMTSAMPVNFRQVLDRALAGNPAAPDEFDTFRRNAREVARRRSVPLADLLREFERELDALMATYRAMSDGDWERPAWFFVGRVRVRTLFLVQLADNVFHDRDLLVAAGRSSGLDPEYAAPLVDWFLREFRPATFRPDRARGLDATAAYRLSGPAGGAWTLTVKDGACHVEPGARSPCSVTVEADAEQLVAAAQARAAPWVGRLARRAAAARLGGNPEDSVARLTGMASLGWALTTRRLRVHGDRATAARLNGSFWHFWERTAMTAANIAKG